MLDEPPDEIGPYSIAYHIKHGIVTPIRRWVANEPYVYLDADHNVRTSSVQRDYSHEMAPVLGEATLMVAPGAIALARSFGARSGFSATELSVVNEVRGIPLSQLRAAYEAGGTELTIGGRTILVDPGVPASGMTLFGENGFVLGREAFVSEAELTKTLLHETYRLTTSQSAVGVSGAAASAETNEAFSFAERAYGAWFK